MRRLCCDIRIWGDPAHRGGRLRRFLRTGTPADGPRSAETILDASRDMRTEILCHRTPFRSCWSDWGARYPRLSRMQKTLPCSFGSSRFSRSGRRAFAAARCPRCWKSRFFGWGRSSAPARSRSRRSMRWTFRSGSCAMRCEKKDRAAVRLYPSLGLAAGCLLAVLLL